METADLSEHGTQRLEMKGDQEMPGRRVFKKPTYLNTWKLETPAQFTVIQSEPCIVNNSLSQRKLSISISIVLGSTIIVMLVSVAETSYIDTVGLSLRPLAAYLF